MHNVCVVWFRSHKLHADDPSHIIGIYTTRTLAIDAGRKASNHPNDEYLIREHPLNIDGSGDTIWDNLCETNVDYRKHYGRFWPVGFPKALIDK